MVIFPTVVPPIEVVSLLNTLLQPQRTTLPCKTLVCLLHSPAVLVSLQPTRCFAHGLPFSVLNDGQPTSFSIEALYTSIVGAPCKIFPLIVVRIYYFQAGRIQLSVSDTPLLNFKSYGKQFEREKDKYRKLKFEPKPEYLSKVKFPPILERRRYSHENGSETKSPDNPTRRILDPVTISEPEKISKDPEGVSDSNGILDSGKKFDLRIGSPFGKHSMENRDIETSLVSITLVQWFSTLVY